ncbi:hypothetical protein RJ640_013872, partial [Escallonia rubra]
MKTVLSAPGLALANNDSGHDLLPQIGLALLHYLLSILNGGMCMHDEAAPHYIDMIDQTTLGHRFIKAEFNITPRIGWQIDPFGHSAVQVYLLGAETFAGAFPEAYEPPNGFYFEVNDDSPIVQDDINLFDYNVQDRVQDFVDAALAQ